jgi:hypothetical protein
MILLIVLLRDVRVGHTTLSAMLFANSRSVISMHETIDTKRSIFALRVLTKKSVNEIPWTGITEPRVP